MKNSTHSRNSTHKAINLSVPTYLYTDLKRLADCASTTVENLAFSYILDGITSDRHHFEQTGVGNRSSDIDLRSFHEKSAQEIIDDLDISYEE